MSDKEKAPLFEARAFELPGGSGGLGALLGALVGGLPIPGEDTKDHPLLKKMGVKPAIPFKPATKEQFLAFIEGVQKLKVGDIVQLREDIKSIGDLWPLPGQQAIVSQVLAVPMHDGTPFTEQPARNQDVALMFVKNVDDEVLEAMKESGEDIKPEIYEFLFDSRRLKKVGSVFDR